MERFNQRLFTAECLTKKIFYRPPYFFDIFEYIFKRINVSFINNKTRFIYTNNFWEKLPNFELFFRVFRYM